MPYSEEICNRFWGSVQICAHGVTCEQCCWPWLGTLSAGYGILTIYDKEQYAERGYGSRTLKAARLALEIHHKSFLPSGIWALHACNNPPCCNHNNGHVYPGTPQDNAYDTVKAGHHVSMVRPETNGRALLNWVATQAEKVRLRNETRSSTKLRREDVLTMRFLSDAGFPSGILASIFDISSSHASKILLRRNWKHI